MHHINTIKRIGLVGLVFFWISLLQTQAQEFLKFPITQSGIYKLDLAQVRAFGYGSLDQISVFGNPGMLAQRLDSIDLTLREVPTKIIGESMFFFLEGPHILRYQNSGIQYIHHHYTDTLYYLLGPKTRENPITQKVTEPGNPASSFSLHIVQAQKWEETNLINSGRSWYSKPIFSGQTFTFGIDLANGAEGPYNVRFNLLSQALAEGRFRISASGQVVGEQSIAAIPNTTYGIKGREAEISLGFSSTNPTRINFNLLFQTSDPNGMGYIDYALLTSRLPSPKLQGGVFFHLDEAKQVQWPDRFRVWEVSNFYQVNEVSGRATLEKGSKLAVFDPSQTRQIADLEKTNLGIRASGESPELLILTHNSLASQARRLATHKNEKGIPTQVFLLEEIYDAFGYGNTDIVAIRNFIAAQYHRQGKLKNVLIFGKGSYDYKGKLGGRANLFPIYTSRNSLNPLTTYSSDDFFGFLEWGQGNWIEDQSGDELLQIGVGRLPALNTREATELVDKIIAYETEQANPGPWKRNLAFLTDDGDNNIHVRDAELHAKYLLENHPEFEIKKLYLDRYEQVKNGNAQTSPEARKALNNAIKEGVLLLNYIGHGNETTLTAERVFSTLDLIDWPTNPLLPLFVTATCEFGRHDSPFSRSGAEELLIAEKKGAIALLTTGRPVFSSVNFSLNKAFIETAFKKENHAYQDLGAIFRITKNNSLNGNLNRNFSLLGDPSMKLALPEFEAEAKELIEVEFGTELDTLESLREIRLSGSILDPATGATMIQANGEFLIKILDEAETYTTKGDESSPVDFAEENKILFQGKGELKDGRFESNFILPKNSALGNRSANVKIFATIPNLAAEAMGSKRFPKRDRISDLETDKLGPEINIRYGPDLQPAPAQFAFSSLPILIELSDPSGINIAATGPETGIFLRVNGEASIPLNSLYFAKEGSYRDGIIKSTLDNLKEGVNEITIVAWDNAGNRNERKETIEIRGSDNIQILDFVSYPNPAIEFSKFKFTHNRPKETVRVELEIYSILGSKIYVDGKRYINADFELDAPEWNFFHSSTNYPVKGIYIYRLLLISEKDGTTDSKSGKITIQ
jgi:hypothetical protein